MRKSHDLVVSTAMNASRVLGPWLLVLGVCLVAVLPSCGKSSSSTPTPVTTPTTTLAPSFSGTYSGIVVENVAQQAEVRGTATVRVTQNGNSLDFGTLGIAIPGAATQTYALGTAVLSGNTFTGASAYQSSGCDVINVSWNGRFAGNLMNLTTVLLPTTTRNGCNKFEIRGELSK